MRVDLHVHSKYSPDGRGEIDEIIRVAKAKGLQGVAIVDHNEVKGSLQGRKATLTGNDFVAIRGSEVSSSEGHVLAYGIQESIPRGLPVVEVVEHVKAQGGVAVAAHPYRFWSGLGEGPVRRVPFDGVEIHNARSLIGHNSRARDLASELKLPRTAGSDAHTPGEIGRATVTILEDGLAEEGILEAVVKGRTEVTGSSRSFGRTIGYTAKCVSGWMIRGMRRI